MCPFISCSDVETVVAILSRAGRNLQYDCVIMSVALIVLVALFGLFDDWLQVLSSGLLPIWCIKRGGQAHVMARKPSQWKTGCSQ